MKHFCVDCQKTHEEEDLNRGSLDAFADLSVDFDYFCPHCGSDYLKEIKESDEDRKDEQGTVDP